MCGAHPHTGVRHGREARAHGAHGANPNVGWLDRVSMTTTTAERTTQATIHEIISAIAGVQALITADVESPFCPFLTKDNLGKALFQLSEALAKNTNAL